MSYFPGLNQYDSPLQERTGFRYGDSPLEEHAKLGYVIFLLLTESISFLLDSMDLLLQKNSTNSFNISFSLLPLKNPSLIFGLFSASAISLNAALMRSLDDVLGIVYFDGNSSIALETCVDPVLVTLTCQL